MRKQISNCHFRIYRTFFGTGSYTENPYNSWPEAPSLTEGDHIPGRQPTGRVDPLYVDLGGNGQDPVYVGDDIYMDPDGKLRDY